MQNSIMLTHLVKYMAQFNVTTIWVEQHMYVSYNKSSTMDFFYHPNNSVENNKLKNMWPSIIQNGKNSNYSHCHQQNIILYDKSE